MKNLITIMMCAFSLMGLMAQNADGPGRQVSQPTPEIQALYSQERVLKTKGDVAGLEANRQAIIAAWRLIDPEIASEFKSIEVKPTPPYIQTTIQSRPNVPLNDNPEWGGDLLLDTGFKDGVDIDTALDGTIYVAAYENKVRFGSGNDEITIYKSTDNGASFTSWGFASIPDDIIKMKLNIMDSGTTKYLFTTYASAGGLLQNLRFNLAGGPLDSETITTGVKDFDIDVDYEFVTTAGLYAVYIKMDNSIYSARSTFNNTGFGWVDEHSLGYFAKACAFTYGKGNTFVLFTGLNTGNLYFESNTGYNSPTSWNNPVTLTDGSVRESKDLSLSAERKIYEQYRVVALSAQRATGSNEDYKGVGIKINNDETFISEDIVVNANIQYWDSWSKKTDGNDIINTSFENSTNLTGRVKNYQNGTWDESELVSDNSIAVGAYTMAVGADADNHAIASYIGVDHTNLYFDTNRILGVLDNTIKNVVYYPNPFSSTLNLKAESAISNVAIFNLLGQQVKALKPNAISSEMDVADLSSGTYIMKVTINGEVENYKIIKN